MLLLYESWPLSGFIFLNLYILSVISGCKRLHLPYPYRYQYLCIPCFETWPFNAQTFIQNFNPRSFWDCISFIVFGATLSLWQHLPLLRDIIRNWICWIWLMMDHPNYFSKISSCNVAEILSFLSVLCHLHVVTLTILCDWSSPLL